MNVFRDLKVLFARFFQRQMDFVIPTSISGSMIMTVGIAALKVVGAKSTFVVKTHHNRFLSDMICVKWTHV